MQDISERILASVAEGFEDQLAFTKELMRCPSTRGAEHAVQDIVFRALRNRGYPIERFEMDESTLSAHEGAGAFSAEHSRVPIVVGHPSAARGERSITDPAGTCGRCATWTHRHVDTSPVPARRRE